LILLYKKVKVKAKKSWCLRNMYRRNAFTLLELLFVFGIIAVLLSIVLPTFKGIRDETNLTKAKTELALLQNSIEQYYTTHQQYPDLADYQTVLLNEGFLKQSLSDPFSPDRNAYEYRRYGDKYYIVLSAGINQDQDFSDTQVDLGAGRWQFESTIDDVIVTNLRRNN
jgi:type II secretory pathway pseudopilin PulG